MLICVVLRFPDLRSIYRELNVHIKMEVADLPNAEVRLNVSFFQTDEENVNLLPSDDPSSIPREDFEYGDPEFEIVTEKLYEVR